MFYQEHILNENRKSGKFRLYIQDPDISFGKTRERPFILICPGGGYMFRATKEGEAMALHFLAKGYHVGVLEYQTYLNDRRNLADVNTNLQFEDIYLDMLDAMLYLKSHQKEWFIQENQIFAMGFSAGGHLSAYLATRWHDQAFVAKHYPNHSPEDFKPAGVILGYPLINYSALRATESALSDDNLIALKTILEGIDENLSDCVSEKTVPVFLFHTCEDDVTLATASLDFIAQLQKYQIPCEFHFFETGRHGLALANETHAVTSDDVKEGYRDWTHLADIWMQERIRRMNK